MIHAIQYADQRLDCLLQLSDAVAHAVDAPAQPRKDGGWQKFHDQLVKEIAATKVNFSQLLVNKQVIKVSELMLRALTVHQALTCYCLSAARTASKVVLSLPITPLTIQMNVIQ